MELSDRPAWLYKQVFAICSIDRPAKALATACVWRQCHAAAAAGIRNRLDTVHTVMCVCVSVYWLKERNEVCVFVCRGLIIYFIVMIDNNNNNT